MNIKPLLTGLSIILVNTLLGMVVIQKLHMPYTSSMFLFIVLTLIMWFFLLSKDVPITIKAIDAKMMKNTLALFLIPTAAFVFILTNTPSVNYGIVSFLFITSFLIAVYEEILFRAIGLGSFISYGLSPFKAILLSSIIFSFCHLVFLKTFTLDSILLLLNSFAMGFILGYIYFKTKNIVYVIGIHLIWDWAIFLNQRVADTKTGTIVTVVLLAVTIWYFIWSFRAARQL
jgi:membrane protease YdiL (CAAX protease family)